MTSPHVQYWSDAQLFWTIQNGVRLTGMPSWKSSISDEDTWRLARFIHHLPQLAAASIEAPATGEPKAELIKCRKTLYRLDKSSWLAERLERFGESPIGLMLGTQDFDSAVGRFKLPKETAWFGQKVAWFPGERLWEVKLGVVGQ